MRTTRLPVALVASVALAFLAALGGSIVYAETSSIDAVTECTHTSPDQRYTYSYVVNECPTIATIEVECSVFDNQRKTLAKSHRAYEPGMSDKPRWNRRCVVVDEGGKHVFTRGEKTFSVTHAEAVSLLAPAGETKVVDNAPCSERVHARGPRRLSTFMSALAHAR